MRINKKGSLILWAIITLFTITIILGIIATMMLNLQLDKNEAETGLRILNEERKCYEFCDNSGYLYTSGSSGGILSSSYPSTCQCKPILIMGDG